MNKLALNGIWSKPIVENDDNERIKMIKGFFFRTTLSPVISVAFIIEITTAFFYSNILCLVPTQYFND